MPFRAGGENRTEEETANYFAFADLKAGAIDAIAIDMTAGSFLIANESK